MKIYVGILSLLFVFAVQTATADESVILESGKISNLTCYTPGGGSSSSVAFYVINHTEKDKFFKIVRLISYSSIRYEIYELAGTPKLRAVCDSFTVEYD